MRRRSLVLRAILLLAIPAVVVAAFAGWIAWRRAGHCPNADIACLQAAEDANPAAAAEFWDAALAQPLAQRVGAAPQDLLALLALDNRMQGFPQRPRPPVLTPDFLRDVRQAMAEIPTRVWQLAGPRLAGIYFVADLGGTGFTSLLRDSGGQAAAAVIVLDAQVLDHVTGNGWATWKENTPFLWDGTQRLQATIETPAHDDRVAAIRYILLHELGHVVAVGRALHPAWDRKAPASLERFAFARESWTVDPGSRQYLPNDGNRFPQHERLAYYLVPQLRGDERADTYRALRGTAFPTLYAATRPGDDFAESFASYVHVVLLHKPWAVTVSEGSQVIETYRPCWGEPRCAGKEALLADLLGPGDASGSSRPAAW